MDTVDDFVRAFHNLDGITLDEKERHFRKLLHSSKLLLQDHKSSAVIAKVTPKTHLELLFKVDILLSCKSKSELMTIFRSGNDILINRIIKHSWFFQEAFTDITAEEIANDVLPQLSYSTRMKVLKKFCMFLKNEHKLYDIFNAVKNKYGLRIAMPLLLGCSNENLKFVIKNNPVCFTPGQLKRFIQKAPKLLPIYAEEYVKHRNAGDLFLRDTELVKLIALADYDVYCELHETYKLQVHYGRRTTKKIFEKEKNNVLMNPAKYENMFEKSAFIRKLGAYGSFKNYFLKSFPERREHFNYSPYCDMHNTKLRFYPKSKQFTLLEDTFYSVYKVPLEDCPNQITLHILGMISDPLRREQIIQKVIEVNDDIEYVVFQKLALSIPFIKKEMNLSSNNIAKRKTLIKALVKTCKINNEPGALNDVIKYVVTRHRNDVEILAAFLGAVKDNYNLHCFQKETWVSMNELIDIYKLKQGVMYLVTDILLHYVEFSYNNGHPIDQLLTDYMMCDNFPHTSIFSHKCSNPKFLKTALMMAIGLLPKVTKKDNIDLANCYYLTNIISWNRKHPDDVIPITNYPVLFKSLKKQDVPAYLVTEALKPLICSKDRCQDIIELLELYWEKELLSSESDVILYYLKWYPNIFLSHIKSSVNGLMGLCNNHMILNKMKKYDYIALPQNIIKYIQGQIELKKNTDQQRGEANFTICENAFRVLAYFMDSNDYISYVAEYKPKSLTIDMTKDDEKELYQIQCYIVTNFKYLNSLCVLPHIFAFCGGDFLKYVLAPLYKIFHRTPENRLQPFFHQLIKNAVSVRKHAVFLALQILDLQSIKNVFKSACDSENNESIKKRYMLSSFNLFQQNASDEFWDVFKLSLSFMDKSDTESFETFVNMSYIPYNYKTLYLKEIWSLLYKYDSDIRQHSLRNKLVLRIASCVKDMSSAFCMEIINLLFLKFSNVKPYDRESINTFICEFLLHHDDPERYKEIYGIIETVKNTSINCSLRTTAYNEICKFISKFCEYFISSNGCDKLTIEHFLQSLSNIYSHIDFFNEYILISLVLILLKVSNEDLKGYVSEVSPFINKLYGTYGPYVFEFLEDNIYKPLNYFVQPKNRCELRLKFIKLLLEENSSELVSKICLDLFSSCETNTPGYQEVIDMFKSCEYLYIQVSLRQKFPCVLQLT